MKKVLKVILIVLLVIVLLALAYLAYVFIAYHRIGDQHLGGPSQFDEDAPPLPAGETLDIVCWNIGFGAYESDYGFFMDGGSQSRAWSEERLTKNLYDIQARLREQDADFYLLQEVDFDSTRSYHVDEKELLLHSADGGPAFPGYTSVFAQNYDSPYLMYPILKPHGASKSGILTLSSYMVGSRQRVELPVETGFTKFLDLDRCYSRSEIICQDGQRRLVLYNLHLSAYTSDGTIATEQLKLLLADMQAEYKKGNWCVAGGDFNKDLLGDSSAVFGVSGNDYTWAQPIPAGTFEPYDISLVAPLDEASPVPSCRNPDSAYHEGQYVLTVDGFLVSANVRVEESEVLDFGFAYSDHNPVHMRFTLVEE